MRQNLDTLSANSIHLFLFEKAFPEVIKKMNEEKEEGEDDMSLNRLLAESGLKCLTTATLHKWLVNLGFKYETRKKLTMLTHMKSLRTLIIDRSLSIDTLGMKCVLIGGYLSPRKNLTN